MKKITLLLVTLTLILILGACEQETPTCFEGWELDEKTNKCVEIPEEEVCYGPTDYSETLTYELVWSDEFDGDTLDLNNWVYEINNTGGGNNELQAYTGENAVVSDGTLKIIAKKEEVSGRDYTSSRITTQDLQEFKYGIYEARIKLPAGTGTWPAFWMMPADSKYGIWPRSGEIDIMEHVGYDQNIIHGTVHTKIYNGQIGTQKGGAERDYDDVSEEFHVYKVEWLPDQIKFYMDDEVYYTYNANKFSACPTFNVWPFNQDFFMILNVAIGGDWGGVDGVDDSIFPVQMEVDYVRVYQAPELNNYEDFAK